ncbi:MAG: caspase family protein [Terriglobales bacterium]|jgi:uncharacterized caspase-like protein
MNWTSTLRISFVLFSGLALTPLKEASGVGSEGPNVSLRLPELGLRIPGNGYAEFRQPADSIRTLVITIPKTGSHVDYGAIHTKVNTESVDVATQSVSDSEGLELKVDLKAAGGFQLQNGRNSVELEYQDQFGRQEYFNFLLIFPQTEGPRGLIPELEHQQPEKRASRTFAVVIGISRYDQSGSGIPNLKYADRDAMSFLEFLRSPAGGSLKDDSVTLLLNEKATTQNIRHALYTFLTAALPQDTVVIYVAGHGAPDPHDPRNLYLLTADSKLDDMGGTAFPMWQIQDVFERILKAKRVITIADTCRSFGFTGARAKGSGSTGINLVNQYIARYAATGQRAVITASDISEPSFEDVRWGNGHGVFTYFLLKGLQGAADKNHDGVITAGELFAYLKQTVPQETNGRQNPRAMEGLASALPVSILHSPSVDEHLSKRDGEQ